MVVLCLAERNPSTSTAGRRRCPTRRTDPCRSRVGHHLRGAADHRRAQRRHPYRGTGHHKRVARVMREHGIVGYRRRRRVATTIPKPNDQKVPDLLNRDFTAPGPNQRYVGDITYLALVTHPWVVCASEI